MRQGLLMADEEDLADIVTAMIEDYDEQVPER